MNKESLPVIKTGLAQSSPRKSVLLDDNSIEERRKSIQATLTVSAIVPAASSPQSPIKATPPPVSNPGDRLYRQSIRNPRNTIRRMRSKSTGDLEHHKVDVSAEKPSKTMAGHNESASKKPTAPTAPSPRKASVRPARPVVLRQASKDDSCIKTRSRSPRRPSYVLTPSSRSPPPEKSSSSPFRRFSMFTLQKFTKPVDPTDKDANLITLNKRVCQELTHIKPGLEKGLLTCIFTGPAVFWKKRLTFSVSVYLHTDEHDCLEVVAEDPKKAVEIRRVFVRPSVLYKVKENHFKSKLAGIESHRKDLMDRAYGIDSDRTGMLERAKKHLAGELIVSMLQISEDLTWTEGVSRDTEDVEDSSPHTDEKGEEGNTVPAPPSAHQETQGSPEKNGRVRREIVLSVPYFNDDTNQYESLEIPRPLTLPICL